MTRNFILTATVAAFALTAGSLAVTGGAFAEGGRRGGHSGFNGARMMKMS